MAKELGADFQLQVKIEDKAKQLAQSVADKLGVQPHVAIECTGAESCVQTAIYVSVVLRIEGLLLAVDRVVFLFSCVYVALRYSLCYKVLDL